MSLILKNKKSDENTKIPKLDILIFAVTALIVGLFILYMYTEHHTYFTDRSTITTTTIMTDSYGRSDINKATVRQISDVDGIGRKLGQKIYDYIEQRNGISSMDELLEIDGIGEAKLEDLCKKFYAGKSPATTSLSSLTEVVTTTTSVSHSETPTVSTTENNYETATKTTTTSHKTTTKTATTTKSPQRTRVNLNTADADELCRCLLIDYEQAAEIINLRNQIGGFTNKLEILYCKSISDELYSELEPYLEI